MSVTVTDERGGGARHTVEVRPLAIGPLRIDPPVVLAPMAGVTTPTYRALCRSYGAALFVSEMVSARGLVDGQPETLALLDDDRGGLVEGDAPRSVQLSGTDPAVVGAAVRRLVGDHGVDHVDLNTGCPTRKVTREGAGAALPWKADRLAAVVGAAVAAAGSVPVTVKTRIGIDDAHRTHLDVGRIVAEEGAAAVALHARTAATWYSGTADWSAIAELRAAVPAHVAVLGNGDVFAAPDAVAMLAATGCDGVVIGRGCLGRPWFFRELAAALAGRPVPAPPPWGEVAEVVTTHAQGLARRHGELRAVRSIRRHLPWYLTGYPVPPEVRATLVRVESLAGLAAALGRIDPGVRPDPTEVDGPRGPVQGPQIVALPDGWLAHRS
ncbi:MAG TPA: tRNA dihydrouridine synthase DusB [Acidimicrobiales bacterium]|nr:tRNA dihydrouridine synthase DusB [Acidimicrobiales bacterium]